MKVRTEARRDAILEVAAQVFGELGFERATMNDISARVGGSKATLYGYFPSKEALFVAVTQSAADRHFEDALREMQQSGPIADLRAALLRFADQMLRFMAQPETLAAHRMVVGLAGQTEIGRQYWEQGPCRGVDAMATYLQAAMAQGLLRESEAQIAAKQFIALVQAEMHERQFLPDPPALAPKALRGMAERAVDTFLHGHAAPRGRASKGR